MRSASETRFAHPAEQEPRACSTSAGSPGCTSRIRSCSSEILTGRYGAFTPDFYLPDLDLYIECTVMRQTLATRKRQEVRKSREQEGVTVEILYGRDLQRLAGRWSLDGLAPAARRLDQRGRLERAV